MWQYSGIKGEKKSQLRQLRKLGDIMELRELEENYPHTVGFFKGLARKRWTAIHNTWNLE